MSLNTIYVLATIMGAIAALGTVLYLRRQTTATEKDEVRDEAMDLARLRGDIVTELRRRLDAIEQEQLDERSTCARKIEELHKTIELVREEASEAQRMLMVGLRGVLVKVLSHLETEPSETDEAIHYLRDALSQEAPPAPSPWRNRR